MRSEDLVRFHLRRPQHIQMAVAESDAHRVRSGRDELLHLKTVANEVEDRDILGSKINDGDLPALGSDPTGVATHASLASGGNRLDGRAGGVVNQQLVVTRV